MTEKIFLHIIYKIFQIVLKHRDFFEKKESEREALLEGLNEKFVNYLKKTDEKNFMQDLAITYHVVKGKAIEGKKENELADALIQYITHEIGMLIDKLPLDFYMASTEKREELLEEKFHVPPVFRHAFAVMTYQEITEDLFRFIKSYLPETPYIVIQSARDTQVAVKKELRAHFQAQYPNAFPIFQVSKHLYGGMKVFVNGEVTDESYLGKIQRFTTALTTS